MISFSTIFTDILDLKFTVVIVGGQDIGNNDLDIVEVVDNYTNCKADTFPRKLYGAVGIHGMICGGESNIRYSISSCWHLNPNGKWTEGENMLERRVYFSLNKIDQDIIAIGGQSNWQVGISSVEKYSLRKNGGWSRLKDAPILIERHCTVIVNISYLLVTGGYQNAQVNFNHNQKYV